MFHVKQLRDYQLSCVNHIKHRLKKVTYPLLINASVGAGKSLIIAELLLWMEKNNYHALCLTMNSTLIKQNAETYTTQGGHCGIYSASINRKESDPLVIFASPQSLCNAIKNQERISDKCFQLILVDECHNIHPTNFNTLYQRIINHYGLLAHTNNYSYRIVGLTGTPYRDKNESIVGEHAFFKEEAYSIPMHELIEKGYLTKPVFNLIDSESYDFSKIEIKNNGKFDTKELNVISGDIRLTGKIMHQLQVIMQSYQGAFIFLCSKRHCEEAIQFLPEKEARIITGETSYLERENSLEQAKQGKIRYLLSVNVLFTGIDLPIFDVVAWLRPSESLIIFTQGIGRVLRLSPNKSHALILDYAGNLERHGDIDDPIINDALTQKIKGDPDYCIPCYTCSTWNTIHSRRCIGIINDKRCEHYFEFKDCPSCAAKNDKTARYCRECRTELIDPNAKLHLLYDKNVLNVISAKYWVEDNGYPTINVAYKTEKGYIYEHFRITSIQSKRYFYGQFVSKHIKNGHEYFSSLNNIQCLKNMIYKEDIMTPIQLICGQNKKGQDVIKKKIFNQKTRECNEFNI